MSDLPQSSDDPKNFVTTKDGQRIRVLAFEDTDDLGRVISPDAASRPSSLSPSR